MKKCAILSVGQEILFGYTIDTNAAFFCSELRMLGIEITEMRTVNDIQEDIVKALQELAARADFILVSGGLGPTPDDLTRQAIAQAAGVELILQEELLESIQTYFNRIGHKMVASNTVQAMLPATGTALPNNCGTAPGIRCRIGNALAFSMPGVPSEMKRMFAESVRPELAGYAGESEFYLKRLHLCGLGESTVGEYLRELQKEFPELEIGTTVDHFVITVRISSFDRKQAEQALALIRKKAEGFLFGEDGCQLEEAIVKSLNDQKQTLALAESCTGGIIAAKIVGISGASKVLLEGVVSYSNESKIKALGVTPEIISKYGAVSARCAQAMAQGVREKTGADYALSVTGIAGPEGGTAEKPVGTVYFAIAAREKTHTFKYIFPQSDRNTIRQFTANFTLDVLRRIINNLDHCEETPLE